MGKKNNQLKILANLAKQRMLNKDYKEAEHPDKFAQNKVSEYFLENARAMKKITAKTEFISISSSEDENFIKKVVAILRNGELNSLGELTDRVYYETLTDREKQFYMLKLSEKLNKIKELYDKNMISSEYIA